MRSVFIFLVLAVTNLWSQSPASPSPALPPETVVLTISGLCSESASQAPGECRTVVTRKQLEDLIEAVQPQMDPDTKQHMATAYPQFLIMAHEAEIRGLDKSSHFQERMAFARLQILSQELVHQIQDEAANVPTSEIEDYYKAHKGEYEEATLERIVVPLRKDSNRGAKASPSYAEMKSEALKIRERAAAGESFVSLQKEVFVVAGVSGNSSPDPRMEKLRRRGLPLAHVTVFDLNPGEVSQLISDASGHYIYKMDAKNIIPLDEVKEEIMVTLRRERMKSRMEALQKPFAVDVNHAYFDAKKK